MIDIYGDDKITEPVSNIEGEDTSIHKPVEPQSSSNNYIFYLFGGLICVLLGGYLYFKPNGNGEVSTVINNKNKYEVNNSNNDNKDKVKGSNNDNKYKVKGSNNDNQDEFENIENIIITIEEYDKLSSKDQKSYLDNIDSSNFDNISQCFKFTDFIHQLKNLNNLNLSIKIDTFDYSKCINCVININNYLEYVQYVSNYFLNSVDLKSLKEIINTEKELKSKFVSIYNLSIKHTILSDKYDVDKDNIIQFFTEYPKFVQDIIVNKKYGRKSK